MTASITRTAANNSPSSDRTPVLATVNARSKPARSSLTRLSGSARRLLNALMQSLAAPHI